MYIKESLHLWEKSHLVMVYDTGFPGGSDGKEFACNAEDMGLIPALERAFGEEKSYPP